MHVGAFPLQTPLLHVRVALPMRACPIGHEYEMFAPFVKLRPETVVFCSEFGEPHDKGSVIIEMKMKIISKNDDGIEKRSNLALIKFDLLTMLTDKV